MSFLPVSIPIRGNECTHIQCFDFLGYVISINNADYKTWKCPLCSKPCHRLKIDLFFKRLIDL